MASISNLNSLYSLSQGTSSNEIADQGINQGSSPSLSQKISVKQEALNDSRSLASKIMGEYQAAEIITPPKKLAPIYVSKDQSDQSLKGLAITHSVIKEEHRKNLQVFEVPSQIRDDCSSYCNRAYSPLKKSTWGNWNSDGWVELADKTDFCCRKCFAKVFKYESHYGLQWGDGTILQKFGHTRYGATPVYRFLDPHHPKIVEDYGRVQSIWIQKLEEEAPIPFYRFGSTYLKGPCLGSESHESEIEVLWHSKTPYEEVLEKLLKEREQLRKDQEDNKSSNGLYQRYSRKLWMKGYPLFLPSIVKRELLDVKSITDVHIGDAFSFSLGSLP